MYFRLSILLLICFVSCKKEKQLNSVIIIAHAGNGLDMPSNPFPDNTTDAVSFSINQGADGVELDIQLSKDGKWVLFHDDYLDGKTSLSGCINDYTAEELKSASFSLYPSQHIHTLEEISIDAHYLILDVRHYVACSNKTYQLDSIVIPLMTYIQLHTSTSVIINSSYIPLLDTLKQLGLTVCYDAISSENMKSTAKSKNYPIYTMRNSEISSQDVSEMHALNYKIVIFSVRSQEVNKSALAKNPDFLMTDKLEGALTLNH